MVKKIIIGLLFSLIFGIPIVNAGDQSKLKKSIDSSTEKVVNAHIKIHSGSIFITPSNTKKIFNGVFLFEELPPKISYKVRGDEGELLVKIGNPSDKDEDNDNTINIKWGESSDTECQLSFTNQLPLDLNMEYGFISGELDLGGLRLTNTQINAAVSDDVYINFSEENDVNLKNLSFENGWGDLRIDNICNANFDYLKAEFGAGSYTLDFSGTLKQDAEVSIELGVGKLDIYLPRKYGVQIETDKTFLSRFNIDDVHKKNGLYYNDKWNSNTPKLEIRIETGVGSVNVYWID